MNHPLGDTAEDAGRWWRAYLLAENDQAGELRQLAEAGDEHARRQLASWLADRARTQEAGPPAEATRPCTSWPAGWPVTSSWTSCATSSLLTGSCCRAGWPGSMA
jgi:hypothetical protein